MSGTSRYNGPGAALRGQPRAPRQQSRPREDSYAPSNATDNSSSYPGMERQRTPMDRHDPSASGNKELPDTLSPRTYAAAPSHQRQWSDTSSLQGGALPPNHHQPYPASQDYPYSNNNHSSPYMGPSSGSPVSPPVLSPSPSSSSSYFYPSDNRGPPYPSSQSPYGSSQRNQQPYQQHPLPSQGRANQYGGGGGGSRPGANGYSQNGQYDQSPMMSPSSPDSWRSPPGPRGYPSQTPQYSPASQYRQPAHQKPYSASSSVLNDDHGGNQGRSTNHSYEYDSDEYANRQGRPAPGYRRESQDKGPGRFADDRGGRALSYSTSVASNTSSVLAARRERNERNERNQRQKPPQTDEWLTSPTGTEQDTEILPWSDDEAIVTKAVRSPPTGYSGEKSLPPIPGRGSQQFQTGKRMDSDMVKVEVGGATTIISTTSESSGVNFIKNVSSPTSPPPTSRYNNAFQGPSGAAHSMTGAATSLRNVSAFTDQKSNGVGGIKQEKELHPQRPSDKRGSSGWGGKRISLDDMLSSPAPAGHDSRQQAANSWRTSPPLRPREDNSSSSFTDMKSKRRSSLPEKFVPNWNEHAQTWRSSIGQRRPSWMASNKGVHSDDDRGRDMDDLLVRKQSRLEQTQPTAGTSKDKDADADKRLSDQRSLHRRSRSWSPRPALSRNVSSTSSARANGDSKDDRHHASATTRRRDSFASSISRSRSRSRPRRAVDRKSQGSFSNSRSRPQHSRPRSGSQSGFSSHSNSRSRSPLGRNGSGSKGVGTRSTDPNGRERDSSRFSWRSTGDATDQRRSWDSVAQPSNAEVSRSRKEDVSLRGVGGPRYSTAGEDDLTDYEDGLLRDGKSMSTARSAPALETRKPSGLQDKGGRMDSDNESLDSPPLKVQYARRAALDSDDDDDDRTISSKHPASIISTFNLPLAASLMSPPLPPPLPTSYASGDVGKNRANLPMPPPIPDSPPQSVQPSQSMMTSVTTVSIEAATSTLLSSRISVDSFKNVPGYVSADARRKGQTDSYLDTDFESDAESTSYKHDTPPLQPSYVSMTTASGVNSQSTSSSTAPTSNPISITTSQLSRNESSTSSISVLSARSGRSFVSSSSAHSASILPGSPPPQRAPPPIPNADSGAGVATIGSGLFATTKRSDSGGSARGVRSGLSRQVLPPPIPLPAGPPPEVQAGKPSYGILPPPIPSSFNIPSTSPTKIVNGSDTVTVAADATASSAIQIQMLADEDQSKSQMGAITVENDERLLTRLNNRIAQLEKELEFTHQDLEASQDDTLELQNKVQDLENELEELIQSSNARAGERSKSQDEELESAKKAWEQERIQLVQDLERLREDHQNSLEESLERERFKHGQEVERLTLDQAAAMEDKLARAAEDKDRLQDDHLRALEEQKSVFASERQQALDNLLSQIGSLETQRAMDLQAHEAMLLEHQQEFGARLDSVREESSRGLEEMKSSHGEVVQGFQQKLQMMETSLTDASTDRDQAVNDLIHHKKETEQALDRLEVVLAEDKQAHAQLIQDLETKSKRMEGRVAELETELQELMQDNVQIVEEMQRREESWTQERELLRSGQEDQGGYEARLHEIHEQLVTMTESKRQADSQFQGIVKGLLREASATKKELGERQSQLDQERQGKEQILEQLESIQEEKQSLLQEKQSLLQERESLLQEKELLDKSRKDVEAQLETHKRSGNEAFLSIQNELEDRLRQQEEALEAERSKTRDLEGALEQGLSKAKGSLQQEQFVWKTRLDQVEAALKTKEAQVRKLEQEADATIKIQTDLLQSMERDAANSHRKLETSLMAKMKEMEQMFEQEKLRGQQQTEQEKIRVQQQTEQALLKKFEQDSSEIESQLQQQLEAIHKQELAMAKQELVTKHEQQVRTLKQQHGQALEQSSQSTKKLSEELEEQLEKLQQQADMERSEKEVAVKDRTFLERRMAGHDRRQKELEESLESLQQQLDQSRAKFGQDLQEVERLKMSLERKLGMAKEDVEELNRIRDELEGDRDDMRKELQRLKSKASSSKARVSESGSGAEAAAWEAERRHLQEQVRKLEDEVQIMLEKNMNLTIELSMRG